MFIIKRLAPCVGCCVLVTAAFSQFHEFWSSGYGRFDGGVNGLDRATDVKVNAFNQTYVCGYAAESAGGVSNMVVLKYSSDGTVAWQGEYDNPDHNLADRGLALALDSDGNAYCVGWTAVTSGGGDDPERDLIVVRFNSATGTKDWSHIYAQGSSGETHLDSEGRAIAILEDGSNKYLYVTGTVRVRGNPASTDYLTIKIDADDGTVASGWSRDPSSTPGLAFDLTSSDDEARALAIDPSGGVVVTGYSDGNDWVTVKYTGAGAYAWTFSSGPNYHSVAYSGDNSPGVYQDEPTSIVIDQLGDIYVCGWVTLVRGGDDPLHDTDYAVVSWAPSPSTAADKRWAITYDYTNRNDFAYSIGLQKDFTGNAVAVFVTGSSESSLQWLRRK